MLQWVRCYCAQTGTKLRYLTARPCFIHMRACSSATLLPTRPPRCAGAIGGRLDHTLSNLNALYMYPQLRLVLVGEGNVVRLLNPGTTEIVVDKAEGQHCGVVPLARPARVTSKGLRWDMGALAPVICKLWSQIPVRCDPYRKGAATGLERAVVAVPTLKVCNCMQMTWSLPLPA